eukprot:1377608-Rhodomonas_salina.1
MSYARSYWTAPPAAYAFAMRCPVSTWSMPRYQATRCQDLTAMAGTLRNRDKEVTDLKSNITLLQDEVKGLQDLKSDLAQREKIQADLESELEACRKSVASAEQELTVSRSEAAKMEAAAAKLEAQLAEMEAQLAKMEADGARKDALLATMAAEVAAVRDELERRALPTCVPRDRGRDRDRDRDRDPDCDLVTVTVTVTETVTEQGGGREPAYGMVLRFCYAMSGTAIGHVTVTLWLCDVRYYHRPRAMPCAALRESQREREGLGSKPHPTVSVVYIAFVQWSVTRTLQVSHMESETATLRALLAAAQAEIGGLREIRGRFEGELLPELEILRADLGMLEAIWEAKAREEA